MRIVFFFVVVLYYVANTHSVFGQTNPRDLKAIYEHQAVDVVQRHCNTLPQPTITLEIKTVYVHISWANVTGAKDYEVERTNLSLPNQAPQILRSMSSSTEYWDVVPDLRYDYQYTVFALGSESCPGFAAIRVFGESSVTVNHSALSTPNPQFSYGVREPGSTNISISTDGRLIWSGVFGAIAYRIDGFGIPGTGLTLNAGSFTPGMAPTIGPFTPPLIGNNTSFDTAFPPNLLHVCNQCNFEYKPVSVVRDFETGGILI